jgi:uncharacterized RmlC-like cupin family protein
LKQCRVIRNKDEGFVGKQGLNYLYGVDAESCQSVGICMHMLIMPPGALGKPHYHDGHETALYMLEGASEFLHGPNLEFKDRVEAGDIVYIPAGVPHQPYNPTNQICKVIISRTDPNEQESVVVLPDDFPNALKECPTDLT